MTHKRTLKVAERVATVAALTTLLLALFFIWGNVISERYTALS